VTKLDLAVIRGGRPHGMIGHLKGRPSRRSDPSSCAGLVPRREVFQRHRHAEHLQNVLELVRVLGDRKPLLQIERVEGLAAWPRRGLENCPMNCARICARHYPGRLAVRSDPRREVEFARCHGKAAKEMRAALITELALKLLQGHRRQGA